MSTTRGLGARLCRRGQQPVDERRRHAVRRGGEHRRHRVGRDVLEYLVVSDESQVRQHRLQVTEELRDRLVGLAVRRDGGDVEIGMRRDQAQQFAGHVSGAAEHHRGNARGHSEAAPEARATRPRLSMM